MVAGMNWPGWPVLPVLMLAAGFVTVVTFMVPAAPGSREDTADAPGASERRSGAMGGPANE